MDGKEEYQQFFIELSALLEKYNFMIGDFVLGKAKQSGTKLISFNSDGRRVYPVYYVPDEVKIH